MVFSEPIDFGYIWFQEFLKVHMEHKELWFIGNQNIWLEVYTFYKKE